MITSRHSNVLRRRTRSGLLTSLYVFGLLVTVGHLACGHIVCPCICHGEQDVEIEAPRSTEHPAVVAVHAESCDQDHEFSEHADLSVAAQKPVDTKVRPLAWLTSTTSVTDSGHRVNRLAETAAPIRAGEVLAAPSRAPPHLRFA
jgi:hypothetical protein